MAKQSLEESVSLFPFLDIMACLIGILVLLITAVTLAQIAVEEEDTADAQAASRAAARVKQYRTVSRELEADEKEEQRLEQLIVAAEAIREQLEEVTAEIEKLEADKLRYANPEQQAEAQRLQEQIQEAQTELKQLEQQRDELREQMAARANPPEAEVRILPSGSGLRLRPTFVECAGGSVVLHDRPVPLRLPLRGLANSEPFLQLLERVREQENGTVVFLVRPDGAATYNTARNVARRNYVRNGKLAVAGQGKLDLSLFQQGTTAP
jgi:seryl-tRNA synthetase